MRMDLATKSRIAFAASFLFFASAVSCRAICAVLAPLPDRSSSISFNSFRYDPGKKGFAFGAQWILPFKGRANIDRRQVGHQNLAASVALRRSVPACIHHVYLVGGNPLPLAILRNHHRADQLRLFASWIISELDFGFSFLAAVSEHLLHILR